MVMRFVSILVLAVGLAQADGAVEATTNCVVITLPKDCKATPECGFDKESKSCMMLEDIPCSNYDWPKDCNAIAHCNWNVYSQACEAASNVDCGEVKWPRACQATQGCGYNTETEKCVPINDLTCEEMHGNACKHFPNRCYFFKKSRACVSLTPVDAHDYQVGGYLPNTCPVGYAAVTDVLECRSVAVAENREWFYTVSALYTGVTGVCTIIQDSPKNPLVNGHMYFGSIGTSRMLSQKHHKLVCVEIPGPPPTATPTVVPSAIPTAIPTSVPTACEDKLPSVCKIMERQGGCTDSNGFTRAEMFATCRRSCNACRSELPTELPCMDLLVTLCPFMSQAGFCETADLAKRAEIEQSCPVSCGVCPATRRLLGVESGDQMILNENPRRRSDASVDCADITLPKVCKETPECGFDKSSKSCMMLEDMPCDNYDWPKTCNVVAHCNWHVVNGACETAADVDCSSVKWPRACQATHGCGYNTNTEECVPIKDLVCEDMHGNACKHFDSRCYFFKKSRACVSLTPVEAQDYQVGGYLPDTCPEGYTVVTDVLECRSVAVAENREWFSTVSALYIGVTGVCTIIEDSPKNPLVNGHMYFGSIGSSRMLAQKHHKLVCVEIPAPTAVPTATPTTVPTPAPTFCVDETPGLCKSMALQGSCTDEDVAIRAEMSANCRLSCNLCPDSVPTMIPTSVPTSIPTGVPTAVPTELPCVDLLPTLCPYMSNAGMCDITDSARQAEIKQSCPVSCDVCAETRRLEVGSEDQDMSSGNLRRRLQDDGPDVSCVDITLPKVCKETPECGFYKMSQACVKLEDMPCDQYDWPTTCNPVSHCNWNHFNKACEAAADVECNEVKWPKACKAAHGCGYNTETEKCVPINDLTCEEMHGDACKQFPDTCYFFKKSRACAALPSVDAQNYQFGGHLPNSCPEGYAVVTDVLECRSVAVALGREWFSTVSALFTGVTGVCSIIQDSPRNPLVNGHMYFGSIGTSRMLAQKHHKLVCGIPTADSTECEDAVPSLCQIMAKAGSCTQSSDEMKAELLVNCPLSCNTCLDAVPTGTPTSVPTETPAAIPTDAPTEEPCTDILPTLCPFMGNSGLCETADLAKRAEIEQTCPVSCGLCTETRRLEVGNEDQDPELHSASGRAVRV